MTLDIDAYQRVTNGSKTLGLFLCTGGLHDLFRDFPDH